MHTKRVLGLERRPKCGCCSTRRRDRSVAVYFSLSFPTFLSSIRWLLTIKKSVLLFRDGLIELFSSKNNALFKKAETPSDKTVDSVDLVSGSFRIPDQRESSLQEQCCNIMNILIRYCLILNYSLIINYIYFTLIFITKFFFSLRIYIK